MADTPKTVCGILDRLTDIGDRNDRATIGRMLDLGLCAFTTDRPDLALASRDALAGERERA